MKLKKEKPPKNPIKGTTEESVEESVEENKSPEETLTGPEHSLKELPTSKDGRIPYKIEKLAHSSIYIDPVFDACKKVINQSEFGIKYGLGVIQLNKGAELHFYQGSADNLWGILEAIPNNDGYVDRYNFRVYNSLLASLFAKEKETSKYFPQVVKII